MTEQELTNEITRWNVYGGAWDIVRMVRHITILHDEVHALTAERDALKAQLGDMLNGRMSCGEPTLDRSERRCDKPRGHSGNHWTYGGAGLEWPRDAP